MKPADEVMYTNTDNKEASKQDGDGGLVGVVFVEDINLI